MLLGMACEQYHLVSRIHPRHLDNLILNRRGDFHLPCSIYRRRREEHSSFPTWFLGDDSSPCCSLLWSSFTHYPSPRLWMNFIDEVFISSTRIVSRLPTPMKVESWRSTFSFSPSFKAILKIHHRFLSNRETTFLNDISLFRIVEHIPRDPDFLGILLSHQQLPLECFSDG